MPPALITPVYAPCNEILYLTAELTHVFNNISDHSNEVPIHITRHFDNKKDVRHFSVQKAIVSYFEDNFTGPMMMLLKRNELWQS